VIYVEHLVLVQQVAEIQGAVLSYGGETSGKTSTWMIEKKITLRYILG
jgi:hypothetical protein